MIDDNTSWYIRYHISQALEGVARELRRPYVRRHPDASVQRVIEAIEEQASKMRGVLSYEADREKVETEDRAESTLADLPVLR